MCVAVCFSPLLIVIVSRVIKYKCVAVADEMRHFDGIEVFEYGPSFM